MSKVCLFGSYVKNTNGIPSGNGGDLIEKLLKKQNIDVIICHYDVNSILTFLKGYVKLFFKHRKIKYDIIIIPWKGILTLPLLKLIHRKPIVYFPAFSIYDTLVNDRKKIKEKSIQAKVIHYVDKMACKWSDLIILESTAEINYFVDEFNLPRGKFHQLPLSADESIFSPIPIKQPGNNFIVLFFGTFIPLHGVTTIVESAKNLQEFNKIQFVICGEGQTKLEVEKFVVKNNLKNIKFLGLVSKEELLKNIKISDVCLGIFGDTTKSEKVLTNKIFQILASQKPLITRESPATNEANLIHEKNCLLVPPRKTH